MLGIGAGVHYQFTLSRPLLRALLASAAIAAQMTLAGCGGGTPATSGRHMQPLSQRMLATLKAKNIRKPADLDGARIAGGPGTAVHDTASILFKAA